MDSISVCIKPPKTENVLKKEKGAVDIRIKAPCGSSGKERVCGLKSYTRDIGKFHVACIQQIVDFDLTPTRRKPHLPKEKGAVDIRIKAPCGSSGKERVCGLKSYTRDIGKFHVVCIQQMVDFKLTPTRRKSHPPKEKGAVDIRIKAPCGSSGKERVCGLEILYKRYRKILRGLHAADSGL